MKTSILNSPFARLALRSLGMAPLEREFSLSRGFSEARRLLFVDSGRLCDLVFFLPVMQALHREQPELELQVMVEDRWAELLRREAMLSGLLVYKTDQLKARSASYYRLLKEVRNRLRFLAEVGRTAGAELSGIAAERWSALASALYAASESEGADPAAWERIRTATAEVVEAEDLLWNALASAGGF